jgi:hypothetical protein
MKHKCPIQKALARCCGTTEDAIADSCECRGYYSVEQIEEWRSWVIILSALGRVPMADDSLYGIKAYFDGKKGK